MVMNDVIAGSRSPHSTAEGLHHVAKMLSAGGRHVMNSHSAVHFVGSAGLPFVKNGDLMTTLDESSSQLLDGLLDAAVLGWQRSLADHCYPHVCTIS